MVGLFNSDRSILEGLVNHVVLPEKLPGRQDENSPEIAAALTQRLLVASRTLKDVVSYEEFGHWDKVRRVILTAKEVHNHNGQLDKIALLKAFRELEPGGLIILHVREQNAGFLISRPSGGSSYVHFEAFEASPRSQDVLASPDALQWDFPGAAVAIPHTEFADESFQDCISQFLQQSSSEALKHFAARAHKSGSAVKEIRDTTDPAIITHMLMTLLESYGARDNPPVLRKRVRDDVCWSDGAETPWRRCPEWLVLRVGLARYLCNAHGGEVGRARYKLLMCLVLANLLQDSVGHVNVQLLHNMKAKLARRIAKMGTFKTKCSPAAGAVYKSGLSVLGPIFRESLQHASRHIESEWAAFKRKSQRVVRPLPHRADPGSLVLSLPRSGEKLTSILLDPLPANHRFSSATRFDGSAANQASRAFGELYSKLSEVEHEIEDGSLARSLQHLDDEDACEAISSNIERYLESVGSAYEGMPEEKSRMILTVMDLWMMMDERAVKALPLLSRYHPGFTPSTLDILHLPRHAEMCRLQHIQSYLEDRIRQSDSHDRTIFDDPTSGCFSERYYDEYDHSGELRTLYDQIEKLAQIFRTQKEEELANLNEEFARIESEIAQSSCLYLQDRVGTYHDTHNCNKCLLTRRKSRMKISIFEHPLPTAPTQRKAVLFELRCPPAFESYRSTTWRIMCSLGYPKVTGLEPCILLQDYLPLRPFLGHSLGPLSLASTKKSWLDTHYRLVSLPADVSDVCVPSGLRLGYHDSSNNAWPGRQKHHPSFAHHCPWTIPSSSALACLNFTPAFAVDSGGPSSHEIIAMQTKCPAGLSVHEFTAYQGLFSGKNRRWPSILLELGSSNLNFSKEETTTIMTRLAVQAGPARGADPLRLVHCVFRDEAFCTRLLDQIDRRLNMVAENWRETNLMDLLITFLIRTASLAPSSVAAKAHDLLYAARDTTIHWIRQLRHEIHEAKSSEASRRCSRYAIWAALLCRRTFASLLDHGDQTETIQPKALQCFVEASITLQDNLVSDPATFPASLKQAVVRDFKMRFLLSGIIRQSVEESFNSLTSAIDTVWPLPTGGQPRSYSSPEYLGSRMSGWVAFEAGGDPKQRRQTVHYHLDEGHLLIDEKPLGRLPAELRGSEILKELFGLQSLLTYTSSLAGMTHMLSFKPNNHQIHIGSRDGFAVVRAYFEGDVLEYIPKTIFGDLSTGMDLPASLVENCVHWLNLNTGQIEVRQTPNIWVPKPSNWVVDVHFRYAFRRKSTLVDPHSWVFQQIAQIFHLFEHPARLTVYQPESGKLAVELRRLELNFFVNNKGLLLCKELKAEIDPDQDAGTWYGLNSKIVVRDVSNHHRRSVLVPMGQLAWSRDGCHVAISVQNVGDYGIFTINHVLGRLDCQSERRLLYLKAQLHAFTSFVLPDSLSRRTGTEEALHCLRSSLCQPWTPLDSTVTRYLNSLALLTPRRVYYPKGLKNMQQVFWDPELTANIQNEQFWSVISTIWEKSSSLSTFYLKGIKVQPPKTDNVFHLSSRSQIRRRVFWRASESEPKQPRVDTRYQARDRAKRPQACARVFEAVSLIRVWDPRFIQRPDLINLLDGLRTIQGHGNQFTKTVLSELLDIDYGLEWGSLVDLCRRSSPEKKHDLGLLLGMLSFRNNVNMGIIRALVAFAMSKNLKKIQPPSWGSYSRFKHGEIPSEEYLMQSIDPFRTPSECGEMRRFKLTPQLRRKLDAEEAAHLQQTERDARLLAQFLAQQWPCAEPTVDGLISQPLLLDVSQAMEMISSEWRNMFQNWEYSKYLVLVQEALDRICTGGEILLPETCRQDPEVLSSSPGGFDIANLGQYLSKKPCTLITETEEKANLQGRQDPPHQRRRIDSPHSDAGDEQQTAEHIATPEVQELEQVLVGLTSSTSTVRQEYGQDLQRSLGALKALGRKASPEPKAMFSTDRVNLLPELQSLVTLRFNRIFEELHEHDARAQWLSQGDLWPCITPVGLLELLRSTSRTKLQPGWKDAIIKYALSITDVQRQLRIIDAQQRGNQRRVEEERANFGHQNWNPLEYPDWLLLEIDANILIRPDQVDVALATISPSSGKNSVLQMNMGQGKTSCVMPMVAAILADSKRLVRVIVPKALLLQTAETMQARLGNLLGREVRHIPFSRRTPTAVGTISTFQAIHQDTMARSGIIVALPEHKMSFKLSGEQRLSDGRIAEAVKMVEAQKWMDNVCRDVLDECDVTLAVRTQLIYPSGRQTSVDGSPHRWELVEALLKLVQGHLWGLTRKFPQSIEVVNRHGGGFPWIFFLRKDVEEALITLLVEDVVRGRVAMVPLQDSDAETLEAVKSFISEPRADASVEEQVNKLFPDKHLCRKSLYQLRGLLVHRLLLLSLKKRWNVQYGLHPQRDPIAVPYHAKSVPADFAEWGHPDIQILFTCLSFYFAGLAPNQLRESLQSILKSDDPSAEYEIWAESTVSLPGPLREWNMINVDDEAQLLELWRHFRYSVVVIEYYLNHSVFPKHAKQFQTKIQASGWDITFFDPVSSQPEALTTGFSGTNDNRTMLPLTIKQDDLPGLLHTNAEVLTYLLQPRNRTYIPAADQYGKRVSEEGLLKLLRKHEIRMLIDAGAQILEMDNKALVTAWMAVDTQAKAALYFRDNKPFILYRNNTQVPLLASPFVDDLGECLVYLDEAHCRGTDLKMPANARGALTLGLGQTKDHTVQAAMRLRQLATTQSVVFIATPEVHQSILDHNQKPKNTFIDSREVVSWLLEQTCAGIEQLQPLYYSQGMDFCRRAQAAVDYPDYLHDPNQLEAYLKELRRQEQQTLERMYQLRGRVKAVKVAESKSTEIAAFRSELHRRRKGFQDTGEAVNGAALQEVEQEREVTQEVEAVREVQKPHHFTPMKYGGLHADIVTFARTGKLVFGSTSCEHLSAVLSKTATGRKHRLFNEQIRSKLLVSREFLKSVSLGHRDDRFLHSVSWILWSEATETALVVIPEEAEDLIPRVRKENSSTHLMTYAAPVSRKMLHFNRLRYYSIPALPATWSPPQWLMIELGLLAGRFYFEYEECASIAKYFGVSIEAEEQSNGCDDTADKGEGDNQLVKSEPARANFRIRDSTAPTLEFLQEWLSVRRKGQDFSNTPMGAVCQGKLLSAEHPFFS
ncbi:hypothetical protein IWZ00DRAFT_531073 [Phyllosticta capitalensis]